jgi:hypothetical protein
MKISRLPGILLLRTLSYDITSVAENYPGISDKDVMNMAA